jgi:nitrate/nitrite transport system substrate-binding protein
VTLEAQANWKILLDRVISGELDGAHMLAGQPIAATIGFGTKADVITAFSMDLNGNGITVSNALYQRMVEADPEAMKKRPTSAQALKKVIDADKRAGKPPMTFAMVFPVSTHNYEIRYWMASAGIDPDKDVRLIVVPPPQMVANLSAGRIQGYCVGEPWNAVAVSLGVGKVVVSSSQIWGGRLEKVLGVREDWADANPHTHKALIKALLLACQWADQPENRAEVAELMSAPGIVNAPLNILGRVLADTDGLVFQRHAATFPWRSQALWYLTQMCRWGQLGTGVDLRRAADRAYRSDIYRLAALELDWAVPLTDAKSEGRHSAPWTLTEATKPIDMGPDAFIDGAVFDPDSLASTQVPVMGKSTGKDI